ncbi:hypothetical protein Dimus_031370 [Dionaea muscipula]
MEESERDEAVAGQEGEEEVQRQRQHQHQKQRRQEIWSWGAGTEGQLGTGTSQDAYTPQLLSPTSPLLLLRRISHLSCGGAHVIALTSCNTPIDSLLLTPPGLCLTPIPNSISLLLWLMVLLGFGFECVDFLSFLSGAGGKVLTWGRGTSGQLGHGDTANRLHPHLVVSLEIFFISHVSAGWNHSGFVSDSGKLFTCGDGSFGQLGHGDYLSYRFPTEVSFFGSKHVEQIACGMRHSLVLVRDDSGTELYGFGSGKRGQLGISKNKIKSSGLPQLCLGLEGVKIVSAIVNGDHSAALTADGQLYTWGRDFNGTSDASLPWCLRSSLSFKQAALGWNHALLLTGEGDLFMLGGYRHQVLGVPEKMNILHGQDPVKVPGVDGIKIAQIAAGAEHSALVTGKTYI